MKTKLDFTAVMAKDGHNVSIMASTQEELDTQAAAYEAKGYVKQ